MTWSKTGKIARDHLGFTDHKVDGFYQMGPASKCTGGPLFFGQPQDLVVKSNLGHVIANVFEGRHQLAAAGCVIEVSRPRGARFQK